MRRAPPYDQAIAWPVGRVPTEVSDLRVCNERRKELELVGKILDAMLYER